MKFDRHCAVVGSRGLAVLLILVAVLAVFSAPSSAAVAGETEDCYPDGCVPPTNPPLPDDVSCGVSVETGQVGSTVTATVRDVPIGSTVEIRFGGTVVASTADGPALLGRGAESRDVVLKFDVPDLPPGRYQVVAVGDTFTVACGSGDGFQVLAASTDGPGSGEPGSGESRGGALAFTGMSALMPVVVALSLIALGAMVWRQARRRRYSL